MCPCCSSMCAIDVRWNDRWIGSNRALRNLVGAAQAGERPVEVAHGPMDVGEIVQRVHQLLRDRCASDGIGKRFFQRCARRRVLPHALEDAAEVRQVAGDGQLVAALAIDGERVLRDGQRLGVPPFVPAQQADASQARCARASCRRARG